MTEFYAKAEDSGLGNATGAGWLVPTQQDRAMFFENFTLALIEHPGCVGYHYFRYIDNNDSNKGLLAENYQWWEPMRNSFYKVARDIYALREFLTGKTTGFKYGLKGQKLRLTANPSSREIQVLHVPENIDSEIAVYAINGALLKTYQNIDIPFTFYMEDNPPGIYVVRLKAGEYYSSEKIMVN